MTTHPVRPARNPLRDLSPVAVGTLAGAALNPLGCFWHSPASSTKKALVNRGLYDHGGITALGEEQVRACLPDLPPRLKDSDIVKERRRAEEEASKASGTRAHIEAFWDTRTLTTSDGREVKVKGFVSWRVSRIMCPLGCSGTTDEWGSAAEAAAASVEHAREHASEEHTRLWQDPVASDIERGFLGEPPLPVSDLPGAATVTYVATSVYAPRGQDTPVLSRALLASSVSLSRVLNVVTGGGVGLELVAVWELGGEVEPARAQEIVQRVRPTYGVTSTRFGLVRVDPALLATLPWGE